MKEISKGFSKEDVPLGFGMALSKNIKAMKHFAMMSEDEQKKVIEGTHNLHSKKEMQMYVENLGKIE